LPARAVPQRPSCLVAIKSGGEGGIGGESIDAKVSFGHDRYALIQYKLVPEFYKAECLRMEERRSRTQIPYLETLDKTILQLMSTGTRVLLNI
jgi:hypothetical protein